MDSGLIRRVVEGLEGLTGLKPMLSATTTYGPNGFIGFTDPKTKIAIMFDRDGMTKVIQRDRGKLPKELWRRNEH